MSAPEPAPGPGPGSGPGPGTAGILLGEVSAGMIELCALRGRAPQLRARLADDGLQLPEFGRSAAASASPPDAAPTLALCVRPDRWLVLFGAEYPAAAGWTGAIAGLGAAIDLSCGLAGLHLSGPALRDMLARGCRLDLDPGVFPAGNAAATQMAQVSVILASLPSGMLLLTPATTARHFREWLISTARPFGFAPRPTLTVADIVPLAEPGPLTLRRQST